MGTRRITWHHVIEGRCGFCEQPHTLEISYRCVGCDREVCALCIVTVRETGAAVCPECDDEREEG